MSGYRIAPSYPLRLSPGSIICSSADRCANHAIASLDVRGNVTIVHNRAIDTLSLGDFLSWCLPGFLRKDNRQQARIYVNPKRLQKWKLAPVFASPVPWETQPYYHFIFLFLLDVFQMRVSISPIHTIPLSQPE